MIHSSTVVDPGAVLQHDVDVGPFSVIGPGVVIGSGTRIGSHVIIEGPTRIGERNRVHSFSVLGGAPQDKKYRGEASTLEIGDGNVIRENCTFNRGTEGGGMVTRVGDGNWIMAYVHIAHDCIVGDDNVMANGTTLAGHVEVEDLVTFGAFTHRASVLSDRRACVLGHGHGDTEGRSAVCDRCGKLGESPWAQHGRSQTAWIPGADGAGAEVRVQDGLQAWSHARCGARTARRPGQGVRGGEPLSRFREVFRARNRAMRSGGDGDVP